ncbi:exosortase Y-associated Wzy-like protein [Salinibacter ruber]|uniref:exosortase Y-associated Wzy-like protein n=1 Tax=Salinibacter ruber TaxID=146919 RepID=UPI000E5701BB|nr:hypothetical protein [Salinibacter ruber]
MVLRYGLLFIPYILAALLQEAPTASYLVAWGGSFWILYLTLSGSIRALPNGQSLAQHLFRPIGFTHLIYAGYTSLTSIFYFLDLSGYYYLEFSAYRAASPQSLALAAEAQRYYVLSHAAFAAGVLLFMNYRNSGEWRLRPDIDRVPFLLYSAGGFLVAAQVVRFLPAVGQFATRLDMLALVAAVLGFALAIIQKRRFFIFVGGAVYGGSTVSAFLGGWKGEVLILFILLFVFLYPDYKKTVSLLAPATLVVLLAILPTFAGVVRSLNWKGDVAADRAAQVATERIMSGEANLARTNWRFLTNRLSEMGMFVQYINRVPDDRPYYGFEITRNGLLGIIPGAVWPGKPSLEAMSMERVYENDVVERHSGASAKPKFVVDAYLSWGALGVLIGSLLYGMVASLASRLAERWFGGYLLGSGLVYLSLFRILWMSNSFEFLFNTVFWSFVFMGILFVAGRMSRLLVPRERSEKVSA